MIILFGSYSLEEKTIYLVKQSYTPTPHQPNYVFYLSLEQWLAHFEHAIRISEHVPFGVHISTPDHTPLKYRCMFRINH